MPIHSVIVRACLQRPAILRGPVMWLVAFWLMLALGFQILEARIEINDPPFRSAHSTPSMVPIAEHGAVDEHDHGSGAHHHSDDELTDLLKLGHSHTMSGVAGVLPGVLYVAAAPLLTAPVVQWHEPDLFPRPPSTPFRPPIA